MKTYVLIISNKFPKTHARAGEETSFVRMIDMGLKIHTIRGNYEFWRKRFDKIAKGEAVLSVRTWSGKPYRKGGSQVEVFKFDIADGIGIQKLQKIGMPMSPFDFKAGSSYATYHLLSKNDGLSLGDFKEWFKNCDFSEPMVIIHFTKFRY